MFNPATGGGSLGGIKSQKYSDRFFLPGLFSQVERREVGFIFKVPPLDGERDFG